MKRIKSASLSLMVFGTYMMLIPGLGLMIFPKLLLDLNGLVYDSHIWSVRIVGLLAFIIGSYQLFIAKNKIRQLYKITVIQRCFAAVFFTILWLTKEASSGILLFALIDLTGASWTFLTLKNKE